MGKRSAMATSPDEAAALSTEELNQQIASVRWRLEDANKAMLRNIHRKQLAMTERVKAGRDAR